MSNCDGMNFNMTTTRLIEMKAYYVLFCYILVIYSIMLYSCILHMLFIISLYVITTVFECTHVIDS